MNRYFLYYERSVIWFYDEEKPGVWLTNSTNGGKAPYIGLGTNLHYVLFSSDFYKEITEAEARAFVLKQRHAKT